MLPGSKKNAKKLEKKVCGHMHLVPRVCSCTNSDSMSYCCTVMCLFLLLLCMS
jgi:hypothetical protein